MNMILKILVVYGLLLGKSILGCWIQIANPTYDRCFKDLFGERGTEVEGISAKARLISFLNSLYPEDDIQDLEYLNPTSEGDTERTFMFDILCRCYDGEKNILYDVEIQRRHHPGFEDRLIMYGARVLSDRVIRGNYTRQPKVRVIALMNFILDDSKPSVFHASVRCDEDGTLMSNILSWLYVQLPKLSEEDWGNNQWLRLLSTGGTGVDGTSNINETDYTQDEVKSSVVLLNSIAKDELQRLRSIADTIADTISINAAIQEAILEDGRQQGLEQGLELGSLRTKIDLIFKKLEKKQSTEQIAEALEIDIAFVETVICIADLSRDYLRYCEEKGEGADLSVFEAEAEKRFGSSKEMIINTLISIGHIPDQE